MAVKIIPAVGGANTAAITAGTWAEILSGNTLGTLGTISSGTVSFNAGTNITLSQSLTNKITIMGPANIVSAAIIGGNTSGTTASISSGTMVLAGGTNITLSQDANAITIVGANTGTMSVWQPTLLVGGINGRSFGQGTLHMDPIVVPNYISATQINLLVTNSVSTSSNSSHAGTLSYFVGVYTKNVSTLSLASSSSTNYQWTNTGNVSFSSLNGLRWFSMPINLNLTPGNYWFGHLSLTTSANANWYTLQNLCAGGNANSGSFAGASTGTFHYLLGLGHYSVTTASLPDSVRFNELNNNAAPDQCQQIFALHAVTA